MCARAHGALRAGVPQRAGQACRTKAWQKNQVVRARQAGNAARQQAAGEPAAGRQAGSNRRGSAVTAVRAVVFAKAVAAVNCRQRAVAQRRGSSAVRGVQ